MDKSQLGTSGLEVSRIGLGTVEIGIPDYAVGQQGLVSEADAVRLLQEVVAMGITYIDTARAYGAAEERIGKSGILQKPGVVVGTKCAQFLEKGEDPRGEELEQRIRSDIETSLQQLQTDSLQLVQLHGGNAEQIERGELIAVMQTLKDEGKVQHVGIAVREPSAARAAIDSGFFVAIQVAYSILDQRMNDPVAIAGRVTEGKPYPEAASVLERAKKARIGVINRSVLLKGALSPARSKLHPGLAQLKEHADAADSVASVLDIGLPQLAIRFVLSHPAISTALIGTSSASHIEKALKAQVAGPLSEKSLAKLYDLAVDDPNQVDPAKWPKETQTV